MLQNLKIENVAIIESADIEFENGLNIMTGETGAGKSIIIDSINAVLGERTSKELIRTGASKAEVTALFRLESGIAADILELIGAPLDDDALLIRRVISLDGKSSCRVNGVPVTVGMLKTIGRELIDIHGQHDSQKLLNPESHCGFIDEMADNDELLAQYRECFSQWCSVKKEIACSITDEEEKNRQIELLNYQINEIESAQLTIGEMDELKASKEFFRNSEKIIEAASTALGLISGADESMGALQEVKMSFNRLDGVSQYYKPLEEGANKLREISYALEDAEDTLRSSLDALEYDPAYAQAVEDRLDYLNRLSRKYGATEEDMLNYAEKCRKELAAIEFSDEHLLELQEREKALYADVASLAQRLTDSRITTGLDFSAKVKAELEFLDMPNVVFAVERNATAYNENGADEIEFLISPNAGELPKPLAKIASGGELSRIMLAIKNVLSNTDKVGTLIFDEIDTGVSGRAATKLGKKLHEVARGKQVICVTHLAQIAAKADHHFEISKSTLDGKTFTSVKPLDYEGRKFELARIIGGDDVTQTQLDMAEEMLTNSRE